MKGVAKREFHRERMNLFASLGSKYGIHQFTKDAGDSPPLLHSYPSDKYKELPRLRHRLT